MIPLNRSRARSATAETDHGFAPVMMPIPAGFFCMGSQGFYPQESPVHRVWVDAFELGKFTVTNTEFGYFLEATGRTRPPFYDQECFLQPSQPVVGVSWVEAAAYCAWLCNETGKPYRLPTEAEWERAARAGFEGKLYTWGDEPPQEREDYRRRWLKPGPEPVGMFEPNGYGLYNMGDNVHEWCADWFAEDYYMAAPERNPPGPLTGERRSARGGSWRHQIKISRCAARSSINPKFQYSDFGFRVACSR